MKKKIDSCSPQFHIPRMTTIEYPTSSVRFLTVSDIPQSTGRRSLHKIEVASGGTKISISCGSSPEKTAFIFDGPEPQLAAHLLDLVVKSVSSGTVKIENQNPHLLLHAVPTAHIPYLMGKCQQYMSSLEEEIGVVCFLCDEREARIASPVVTSGSPLGLNSLFSTDLEFHLKKASPLTTTWIAIFSYNPKSRVSMKLKLMGAIESKIRGIYTQFGSTDLAIHPQVHYSIPGFAVDSYPIAEEELSLALGKSGANKRRIAAVSECVVEYIGCCAFFFGDLEERKLARNFLTIILERGRGIFTAARWRDAMGIATVEIPIDQIGWITGKQGSGLHAVEDTCNCICFVDSQNSNFRIDKGSEFKRPTLPPPLMRSTVISPIGASLNTSTMVIMGKDNNTQKAAKMINQRLRPLKGGNISTDNALTGMFNQLFKKGMNTQPPQLSLTNPINDLHAKISNVISSKNPQIEIHDHVDDLTVIPIPSSVTIGSVFIKQVEDEFGVQIGVASVDSSDAVVILGNYRSIRAAELKIMSTIENKEKGLYTHRIVRDGKRVCDRIWACENELFETDTFPIPENDLSFALGHKGSIRKKLSIASGCIIEYVGDVAYLSGNLLERSKARDYLRWVLQQLQGEVIVSDFRKRVDVSSIFVPKRAAGFVNGNKGKILRTIEEVTGTFCFIAKSNDGGATKPLLVCGPDEGRDGAIVVLEKYIKQHQSNDWADDATDASAEMNRSVVEEILKKSGIRCKPMDPWKIIDSQIPRQRFLSQPLPAAARQEVILIQDPLSTAPFLLKHSSGLRSRKSSTEFVNDSEAFPELGGFGTKSFPPQPPKPIAEAQGVEEEDPTPPPPPPAEKVRSDSPLQEDAGIYIDFEKGQVWGDWGMGPNGDPTWKRPTTSGSKLQGAWK